VSKKRKIPTIIIIIIIIKRREEMTYDEERGKPNVLAKWLAFVLLREVLASHLG
jgi:hypothetical protein